MISVGIAGYYFWSHGRPEINLSSGQTSVQINAQVSVQSKTIKLDPLHDSVDGLPSVAGDLDNIQSEAVEEVSLEKQRQIASDKRNKLDLLIVQFNENLQDRTAREEVKKKIKENIDKYNELIAPLVMKEMKQKKSSRKYSPRNMLIQ